MNNDEKISYILELRDQLFNSAYQIAAKNKLSPVQLMSVIKDASLNALIRSYEMLIEFGLDKKYVKDDIKYTFDKISKVFDGTIED